MRHKIGWKYVRRYGFFLITVFISLAVLLAGCQTRPTETQPPEEAPPTMVPEAAPTEESQELASAGEIPAELIETEWVLFAHGDTGNPVVVEPGTRPTAVFNQDGSVRGSGGCNSYNTAAQVEGEQISFGPVASTKMACEIGMEQETAFLGAFESASSFQITTAGRPYSQRLLVNYDSGKGYPEQLVFDAELPLTGTMWQLISYGNVDNPVPTESGVVTNATFSSDGTVSGSGGCNSYNGSYSIQDGQISFGLATSTLMACERGMEQEQAFLAALETAESYRIGDGYLEITYAAGSARLRFSARHLPLENVRWILSLIDGQPLPEGVAPNVVFTPGKDGGENQVNGSAGCNGFFGAYTVDANALSAPGPFGMTQMMCADEVMQVEQSFIAGLEGAQSYETVLQQLTITTASGSLIFYADRFSLEGPVWTLTGLGTLDNLRASIEGTNFTASFAKPFGMPSGVMSGATGCNDYSMAYYANLEEMMVNLPATTQNPCSDAVMEEEQAYFLGLNSARTYRILGNELQVSYGEDQVLVFTGAYPPVEGEGGPLTSLNGTKWWLVSIDATMAVPGSETTAQFAINPDGQTGQISGSGGCNSYNAEITGVFTVGLPIATQSLCDTPPGIMEQESAYLAALGSASDFLLDGNNLMITTGQGVLTFSSQGPTAEQPLPPTETPGAEQPLPTVAIIIGPTEGQVNQVLAFDGSGSSSTVEITAYQWDFGDGTTGEGVLIEHTFTAAGEYILSLTITDANGNTASASIVVTITEGS